MLCYLPDLFNVLHSNNNLPCNKAAMAATAPAACCRDCTHINTCAHAALQLRVLDVGVSCLTIPPAGGVSPLRVGLSLHCAECHPEPSHKHLDNLLLGRQLLLLSSIGLWHYDVIRQAYFVRILALVIFWLSFESNLMSRFLSYGNISLNCFVFSRILSKCAHSNRLCCVFDFATLVVTWPSSRCLFCSLILPGFSSLPNTSCTAADSAWR